MGERHALVQAVPLEQLCARVAVARWRGMVPVARLAGVSGRGAPWPLGLQRSSVPHRRHRTGCLLAGWPHSGGTGSDVK